jgi:hypothetical protein
MLSLSSGRGSTPADARRRSLRRHVVVLGCAALAGTLAAVTASAPSLDAATPPPTTAAGPFADPDPERPPAMLRLFAHADPGGTLDLVAFIGAAAGAADGVVALLAPSTLVEVPSLGARTVAELGSLGDASLLELALENALGVEVDGVDVVDDDRLTAALAPVATLEVELHRAVSVEDERGLLSLPGGAQTVSSADAMRVLTSETEAGELDRLVVAQAILDAWRIALRDPGVLEPSLVAEPAVAGLVRVAAGNVRYVSVPVERLTASTGQELYGLARADVRGAMRRAFPWALHNGGEPRPRVELLNGTGGVGVTLDVARIVVPAGGEVTLTGNVPGFGVDESVVVYYRDEGRPAAEMVLQALGTGRLALADQPLGVVDVTVVIGADLAPRSGDPGVPPAASSEETIPPA